jgi:DNA polymerase III sliding clamp (beta) subunit (PCNA family)
LLPDKVFYDFVNSSSDPEIVLQSDDRHIVAFTCGKLKSSIYGMEADKYPETLPKGKTVFSPVNVESLKDGFAKTLFAINTAHDNYGLRGLYMAKEGKSEGQPCLRVVASDSERMNTTKIFFEGDNTDFVDYDYQILIPLKGAKQIESLCADKKSIDLGLNKKHLLARTESTLMSVRLLESVFPDYRLFMSKQENQIAVPKAALSDLVKKLKFIVDDEQNGAVFDFEAGSLTVSCNNAKKGNATVSAEIDYSGHPVHIKVALFLFNFMSKMRSETILFNYNHNATNFTVTGDDDPNFRGIITCVDKIETKREGGEGDNDGDQNDGGQNDDE